VIWYIEDVPESLREEIPFAVWLLGSQQCETTYRSLRYMRDYENFTIQEMLTRINLLDAHALMLAQNLGFIFRGNRDQHNLDHLHKIFDKFPSTTTKATIMEAVRAAKVLALEKLNQLGIVVTVNASDTLDLEKLAADMQQDNDDEEEANIILEQANPTDCSIPTAESDEEYEDEIIEEGFVNCCIVQPQEIGFACTTFLKKQKVDMYMHDKHGNKIHKKTALANISGHAKISKDRVSRVKGMSTKKTKTP
jgi:hypothetical protein